MGMAGIGRGGCRAIIGIEREAAFPDSVAWTEPRKRRAAVESS